MIIPFWIFSTGPATGLPTTVLKNEKNKQVKM